MCECVIEKEAGRYDVGQFEEILVSRAVGVASVQRRVWRRGAASCCHVLFQFPRALPNSRTLYFLLRECFFISSVNKILPFNNICPMGTIKHFSFCVNFVREKLLKFIEQCDDSERNYKSL